MQDLGYNSHNSMLNLGSIAVFSFVYYFRVILYFIVLKPFVYLTGGKGQSYQKSLASNLFYSEILMLSMEAYIEFLISGYLNLVEKVDTTTGELLAVYIGYYSIILTIGVFPLIFIYVLTRPIEQINEPVFHKKW